MRRGALVLLMAVALPFLPAVARVASADEGSPLAPTNVGPRPRPPLGMLRPGDEDRVVVAPTPRPRTPGRELVVLVGGYQSCACPDDGTFDPLRTRLAGDDRFDVVRFGANPRFPYDTYGSIAPSAMNLRDQIRELAPGYDAVHVVTHSMGGVVADQAFAHGLSHADGVVSYVSWSAPHSGSDAARAFVLASDITGGGGPLREGLLWLRMESDSPAVRDLALARPVPPPAGVVRLDLRVASDLLVTARDAADPGVPTRTLIGPLEGHGGILDDPVALDLTLRTISERRVPPDDRPRIVVAMAEAQADSVGSWVFGAVWLLFVLACASAFFLWPTPFSYLRALQDLLPRAQRRPCP